MESIEITPDHNLGGVVESIYVNYAEAFESEEFADPLLNQELFFSFGDNFQIGSREFRSGSLNFSAALENRLNCVPVKTSGRHLTAGVILKPWGFYSLYNKDGRQTSNKLIQNRNFPGLDKWMDALKTEKNISPIMILEVIEQNIKKLDRFRSPKDNFLKAYYAINNISLGEIDIGGVASELGLSHKAIIRLFHEHIGLTPLKYIHTKVIIKSLKHLKTEKDVCLTQLALDLGFYDQSHFIKIFKSHMNMTPTEFKKNYASGKFIQF